MLFKLGKRFLTETDLRLLFKFSFNFGWKGMRAVQKFQKRLRKGEHFPAFNFISVTNNCNLKCQGCWVTPTSPVTELDIDTLDSFVSESKTHGSYFFGILGGEPLLHKQLFDLFEKHPDCYFLLFTNGTMITDNMAKEMRRLGNVSPLISIEGSEIISDVRRGGNDVLARSIQGLRICRKHRLITGVATSVCKSNIDDLATRDFVDTLIEEEVHYLWYYIYRPVGPAPNPELALNADEIYRLRKFMVDIRSRVPLMIVDSYWDHQGQALCPAATGIGHHISPAGYIEPCPPIQFAKENIKGEKSLYDMFNDSEFLATFRETITKTTRGCILMDNPEILLKLVSESQAIDSSGRNRAKAELGAMICRQSHHLPDREVPETFWPYRIAKKYWFFGFGAYG